MTTLCLALNTVSKEMMVAEHRQGGAVVVRQCFLGIYRKNLNQNKLNLFVYTTSTRSKLSGLFPILAIEKTSNVFERLSGTAKTDNNLSERKSILKNDSRKSLMPPENRPVTWISSVEGEID